MLNLAQMLYGGGGRLVSAQSNQNGAGIVELEDENNPYTFGDMYANQGINVGGVTNSCYYSCRNYYCLCWAFCGLYSRQVS